MELFTGLLTSADCQLTPLTHDSLCALFSLCSMVQKSFLTSRHTNVESVTYKQADIAAFSALTLLVGHQEERPARKN